MKRAIVLMCTALVVVSAQARAELALALEDEAAPVYVHYYAALAHLELGDVDAAIDALQRTVNAGYPRYLVRAAPEFDALKSDKRVVELLQEPDSGGVAPAVPDASGQAAAGT